MEVKVDEKIDINCFMLVNPAQGYFDDRHLSGEYATLISKVGGERA